MYRFKKLLLVFILGIFFAGISIPTVSAQGILPKAPPGEECIAEKGKPKKSETTDALKDKDAFTRHVGGDRVKLSNTLGCAVKLGKIGLFMVPFFITYLIQFLLGIAGLVAVLFVVIGGYHYVIGGITEEKEKGKKTILHALMGLIVALSAWMIINFIQVALTS
jgi:hypothetical protein